MLLLQLLIGHSKGVAPCLSTTDGNWQQSPLEQPD